MITVFHREYPRRLFAMASPPMALYCMGELPKERDCTVAVIGARDCSEYGSYAAFAFGERLGRAGIRVVSGMARGIDGIAQKAALDGGGRTYAVLGCGVDVCYPASQRGLYDRICVQGGVISPFVPGTPPKKQLFPYRNSIVAVSYTHPCDRGQTEKWYLYYGRYGTGTGKGCVCSAGETD